jgi:hypothetical protein
MAGKKEPQSRLICRDARTGEFKTVDWARAQQNKDKAVVERLPLPKHPPKKKK